MKKGKKCPICKGSGKFGGIEERKTCPNCTTNATIKALYLPCFGGTFGATKFDKGNEGYMKAVSITYPALAVIILLLIYKFAVSCGVF